MTITGPQRSAQDAPAAATPDEGSRVVALCAGIVLVLYLVSALMFGRGGTGTDMHRLQAEAFAEGHVDIRPVPDALAELSDPYDPDANRQIRRDGYHDLAYVDGRLYSSHGLTVPLLLAPAEALFGTSPENWLITLAGCCVGFLGGVWILTQARRRFVPDLPDWATATWILAFGLSGPIWFLCWLGNGYEAAIAVAFAFAMLGTAMALRSTEPPDRLDRRWAIGGSVCFGLAIGARPSMVITVVVLAAVAVVAWQRRDRSDRRGAVGDLAASFLPFLCLAGLIAMANWARFGSPMEFGNNLQLSIWDMANYPTDHASFIVPNLRDYLFAVPQRTASFPWIGLRPLVEDGAPQRHSNEAIVGLVYCAPVLVVGAASAVLTGRDMWRRCRGLAAAVAVGAVAGTLALLAVAYPFNASTFRYEADAAPFLILASCGAWAWARRARPSRKLLIDACWIAAVIIGIFVTASIQFTVTEATGVRA